MQTMVPLYGFGGVPYSAVRKAAPRNILDNSDFRNPVNQRGITVCNVGSYGLDRWMHVNDEFAGTVSFTTDANGTTFITSAGTLVGLLQRFIDKNYYDGKYTAAIKTGDGSILIGAVQTENAETHMQQAIFWFPSGTTVVWAAIYEGAYTAATLPEYQPKGYGAELAECQRYYLPNCGRYANGMAYAGQNIALVQIPTPVKMRGAQISVKVVDAIVTSDAVYAITGIEGVEVTANGVIARASVSGGPFSRNQQCTTANTNIDIIADL